MHVKEIEVKLIAQTHLNHDVVSAWIKDLGFEEYELPALDPEKGVTGAALLIMAAAKRCYLAFDVGRNANLSRVRTDLGEYLDNVLKSGHGCYDEETEVLTDSGWKYWRDVTADDSLATLSSCNQHDRRVVWQKPKRLIKYEHEGSMIRVASSEVDLLVTPDHKMWVGRGYEGVENNKYELIKAEDLINKPHSYEKGSCNHDASGNLCADMQLLGLAVGSGVVESEANEVSFNITSIRQDVYLNFLVDTLRIPIRKDGSKRTIIVDQLEWAAHEIYDDNKDKVIPNRYIYSDHYFCTSLLDGLMNSDGYRSSSSLETYDTVSKVLSDQFQIMSMLCGYAANVCEVNLHGVTSYKLHLNSKALRPYINKYSASEMFTVPDYKGMVYCAEVPKYNTLYVRRGGKPVWSGNSVCEHATYTFSIEGVTRVFSAEMNRHRAGVAISEGSMRFIRMDDLGYYIPSIFQDDNTHMRELISPDVMSDEDIAKAKSDSRHIMEKSFAVAEAYTSSMGESWNIDNPTLNFKAKKILTSAFRRVIGIGVSTGGVWTTNVRALRHILAMRGSSHAEEEIFAVADKIADIMVEKEPFLFGDFSKVNGEWIPKYPKV